MNPLDAMVARLGHYIAQLEAALGECHKQKKEIDEYNIQLREEMRGLKEKYEPKPEKAVKAGK